MHGSAGRERGQLVLPQLDARLARDRQQVQHAVGRAAARRHAHHRVQERAAVQERARRHPGARQRDGPLARARRRGRLRLALLGRDQPVARLGQAEAVDRHRHRVRGELAGAGARARARDALDLVQLRARDQPALVRRDRLPHLEDRQLAPAQVPRPLRPAVEQHRRLVDARERHQRRRRGLVAADDAQQRVEVVCDAHQLDRVGDHLARDQRRAHSRRALRLVVGYRDRVERERDAAGGVDRGRRRVGQLALREVAGHRPGPGGGDPDDRAAQPRGIDPHRAEVRSRSRPLGAVAEPGARGAFLSSGGHAESLVVLLVTLRPKDRPLAAPGEDAGRVQ